MTSTRPTSRDKRTAVAAAGRRSFLDVGFAATNLDRVAAAAGVSKMTVYSHFGSKEGLFVEVMEEVIAERSAGGPVLDADVAETELPNLLTDVAADLIRTVRHPDVVGLRRVLIAEQPRHPELAARWRRSTVLATVDEFSAFFERLRDRDLLTAADPSTLASQFLWMLIGDPLDAALLDPSQRNGSADVAAARAVALVLGR